jgi:hypothetical protein
MAEATTTTTALSSASPGAQATNDGAFQSTKSRIEQETQEARSKKDELLAKAQQMHADAEARRASGTAQAGAGAAQSNAGGIQLGVGTVMVATGTAMLAGAFGTFGASATLGTQLIMTGITTGMQGAMQMSQGNQAIAQGTDQVQKAAEDNVISKEHAGMANKEMQRSNMLKAKLEAMNAAMAEVGLDSSKDLSEKQIEDAKAKMSEKFGLKPESMDGMNQDQLEGLFKDSFDKAFDTAADTLANGGIMTVGSQYFVRNQSTGEFSQVAVKQDAGGQPILGDSGEFQIDNTKQAASVDSSSDVGKLLKAQFVFVDKMTEMINGGVNGAPPLAAIRLDENGNVVKGRYDTGNLAQMHEFADLIHSVDIGAIESGKAPAPLKYFEENGQQYFQKWDWTNNQPIGDKVSVKDICGGDYNTNDPASMEAAKAKSNEAFGKLGLNPGDASYEYLLPMVQQGFENDSKYSQYQHLQANYQHIARPEDRALGYTATASVADASPSANASATASSTSRPGDLLSRWFA